MTNRRSLTQAVTLAACLLAAGCATRQGPSAPALPAEYAVLPDTLVCVIDRAAPEGLRSVPAKNRSGEVVLFVDGAVRPLESIHPVAFIAGYAGAEDWLRRGDPISLGADRYERTGGERRIGIDLLRRAGDYQGILLFSGHEDAARPNALYVPTAPGCIFQAYVREELVGG